MQLDPLVVRGMVVVSVKLMLYGICGKEKRLQRVADISMGGLILVAVLPGLLGTLFTKHDITGIAVDAGTIFTCLLVPTAILCEVMSRRSRSL